jgi:hypothetical protein
MMVRWLALSLLACGCVASSVPADTLEQQASSSATGDGPVCPADSPPLECPYPGDFGACGENPTSEFDEQCCRRPICDADSDCADGLVCNYGGIYGFGCSEVEQDGETICECGAPPIGLGRPMCIPPSAVSPDWCSALRTQDECEVPRAPIDFGEEHPRFCRWVAIQEVRLEGETCTIEEALPRCMTLRQPDGNGCEARDCMLDETSLLGAVARPLDATSFELIPAAEILCGVGTPLDDWLPADDASLGPCALTCEG